MEEQQELETAKLKGEEENDDQAVVYNDKDKKQKKKKKEKEKKASLLRAMAYLFGPQFLIGMLIKLSYDVIQFAQPQLVKWVCCWVVTLWF